MIILAGKTCSGKSVVANILREKYGYKRVVTYTTRPPRNNEKDGIDYHFVTSEEFDKLKSQDFFFETTYYHSASGETWHYGTPTEELGPNCCVVMNPEGVKKMKKFIDPDKYHLLIFYLNTREAVIWNRLRLRGDSSDEAMRRIESDTKDFENISDYYDFAITTDLLNQTKIADLIDNIVRMARENEWINKNISCWGLQK